VKFLRFFQPLSTFGFSRILAETKSRFILSPGLISIKPSSSLDGFSAYFDFLVPPRFEDIEKDSVFLHWLMPEKSREKALSPSLILKQQPFYPSFVPSSLSGEDFSSYVKSFLSLSNLEKRIFTLPLTFINSPVLDDVLQSDCSFFILTGFPSLFSNQRKLADSLVYLRDKLPPDIALYVPGPIPPSFFSFLVYSGIDFFDNSFAFYISNKGYFLTEDAVYPLNNHPQCYCPHCLSTPHDLISHNNLMLQNKIAQIQYNLKEGTLRSLVERDIHNYVTFAAALRYYDNKHALSFRNRIPIQTQTKLVCTGEESLNRPEIQEYRERVRNRFTPDSSTKIVLLLPCSAKKPYFLSQSHNLFRQAVRKAGKDLLPFISELIITSPLSVVPRELEGIYPSKFYDIPVSGEWSEKEIAITSSLLRDILAKFDNDIIIINHTHGQGYLDIIDTVSSSSSYTVYHTSRDDRPTSSDSLAKLSSTLKEIAETITIPSEQSLSLIQRRLIAVADYQYGAGTGKILFSHHIKTKGKYPRNIQIFRDKMLLATYLSSTGFLSLQPESAQEIINYSLVNLEFAADKISGSSIYAPGCEKADETIHPSDEIFIVHSNQVLGTAKALVSGHDMNKMLSGALAEVKKKVKKT